MRRLLVAAIMSALAVAGVARHTAASATPAVGAGIASVSAPVLVTVNGGNDRDWARNETAIAVDPTDPRVILGAANDYIVGDSSCGVYWSRDGGASWEDSILAGHAFGVVPTVPQPLPAAPGRTVQEHSRYDLSGDPAVAFDRQGTAYYLCLAANRPENDGTIYVSVAQKATRSFGRAVAVDFGITPVLFNDKPSMAVDTTLHQPFSGRVYVFYTKFIALTGTLIMESHSADHGRTFTQPQIISTVAQASATGTSAVVAPNGRVYVAYENDTANPCAGAACESGQPSEIDVQVSADGGRTYSTPQKAVDDVPGQLTIQHSVGRDNSFPTLAVDGGTGRYGGRLYLAWTDYSSGHADIRFSSRDGGTTWAAPKRLNDDNPDKPGADHVFPALAVAPDGLLVVDWPIDQRDDPVKGFYRPYYTDSRDGGATFSRNVPLSPKLSDPKDDDFGGAFVGDYNGIAADNSGVHPLWVGVGVDTKRDAKHEVLFTNDMPRGAPYAGPKPANPPAATALLGTPATDGPVPAAGAVACAGVAVGALWMLAGRRRRRSAISAAGRGPLSSREP